MPLCLRATVSSEDVDHILKIDGYSRAMDTKDAYLRFTSRSFLAGGHTWKLMCYPLGGNGDGDMDFIALELRLLEVGTAAAVIADATFSLLDQDGKPVPSYTLTTDEVDFSEKGSYGFLRFAKTDDLEQSSSELLKDDCLVVRVDVHVRNNPTVDGEEAEDEAPAPAATMASDLHQHLGHLLLSHSDHQAGTDVEFRVRGETFVAHRAVLRARSPVFKAQLQSAAAATRIDDGGIVRVLIVDDVEPRVFKALLTFIYTDAVPADDDDDFALTQRMLVAADTYGMQRLKLVCEDRLCRSRSINTNSALTLLALAEKHKCPGLREACFDFLFASKEALFAAIEAGEYEHLAQTCPAIANELIHNLLTNVNNPSRRPPQQPFTTVVTVMRGYHVVKIRGYSKTVNSHGARPAFGSRPFRAGGHTWRLTYQPMGSPHHPDNTEFLSLYLVLADDVVGGEAVVAEASFVLLRRDGTPSETSGTTGPNDFSLSRFGFERFIKREELEASECLEDDCFSIGVQVHLVEPPVMPYVTVPPPDRHQHLGDLLLSSKEEDADVQFRVGTETFTAHRAVLAARSPVFMAELLGPMKLPADVVVQVHDMEPQVFDAMLTFIYTDEWPPELLPELEDQDYECAMTQHLLVAADRYGLQRLKLMCEERLCSHISSTGSAANILVLADQHCCSRLKDACFKFLASSSSTRVIENQDLQFLAQACPAVMEELACILEKTRL